MSEIVLSCTPRVEFGKGAARRLRRADQVPAVVYGHGTDPVHLALPGHDTMLALKQRNALVTLAVGDERTLALPKHIQRDPLRGSIEHVDFVVVKRGEKVVVDVAVHTVGDVLGHGILTVEHATLSVRADATNIPTAVEVDVTGFEAGASVHAGEIVLPDGVELVTDAEAVVVLVAGPAAEGAGTDEAAGDEGDGAQA
jgi:large subunit ribosomal protein L25